MVYSKTIKINRKRITKDDVLQLSKIVETEFSDDDYRHNFCVDFWDDSSITDISSEIFNSAQFDRKRTKRIYIEYYSESLNNHIEITLYDSTYVNDSEIKISSKEQLWYDAMTAKFTDVLSSIEEQCILALLIESPAFWGIVPLAGAIFTYTSVSLISAIINSNGIVLPQWIQMIVVLFAFGINITLCFFGGKCLSQAFPAIEFCFGADHMNRGLKIRKAIIWLFLTITPSVVLYFLEKLLNH